MQNQEETPRRESTVVGSSVMLFLVVALCVVAGVSAFYFVREHNQAADLAAANQRLTASLSQTQSRVQALSDKLNALAAPPPPAHTRPSAMSEGNHKRAGSHRTMVARRRSDDPRFKQMQDQLSDQQKQLASTREDLDKTRSDFDGKLNSTRDDINGSIGRTKDELNGNIARTHDELVALEKRGERNYYEFQLDKSKSFQRVGPISVSLRKANTKHKSYNLAMMVDDFQLDKKNINLYEPVWITLSDRPQPLELVVNRVTKDHIQGYLSEPKYKRSELTALSTEQSAAPAAKALTAATPQ